MDIEVHVLLWVWAPDLTSNGLAQPFPHFQQ